MLKQMKQSSFVSAVISLVFGVLLVVYPTTMQDLIGYLLGAMIIVFGVLRIVSYFLTEVNTLGSMDLTVGLCLLTAGVCVLVWHAEVVALLTILLGIFVIVSGIVDLQRAADLYRIKYVRWWIPLLLGVLVCAFGIVILCLSHEGFIFRLAGAGLLFGALCQIVSTMFVSRLIKEMQEAENAVVSTAFDDNADGE